MICSREVFSKTLGRSIPCLRNDGHDSCCIADYTGIRIGQGIIVCLGKPRNRKDGSHPTTWIFKHDDGTERTVLAGTLQKGQFNGKKSFGGYSWDNATGQNTKEWKTVYAHHNWTFNPKNKAYPFYKDMPFHDDWNPDKGGSFWKGAKWIIDNLGKRPGSGWSMDIVEHINGFVPGNIRWALKNQQTKNRQFKKLGQYTDEEFLVEARKRGFTLVAPSENQLSSINQ